MTSSKARPECTVLAPHHPSLTDSDDWPEFVLNDALVTLSNSKDDPPISLLRASEHYPLTLTGRLEPPPKELTHLLLIPQEDTKRSTISIEISDVRSFAYGAYADGGVELWAAGKAGWFVVRPSRAYRPTYNAMVQGVRMLFFIADAYNTPRTSGKGKNAITLPHYNAQEVFKKYAVEVMGIPKAAPEAAQKMYEHRDFLLSSMTAGKEGLAWGKNPLYTHLCRKFPEDLRRIRRRLAGPEPAPVNEMENAIVVAPPAPKHGRQASLDTVSTTSSLKRKRGRPPTNPGADVIPVGSSSVASSAIKEAPAKTTLQLTSSAKAKEQALKPAPVAAASRRTRKNRQASARASAAQTPEIQDLTSATPAQQDSDSDSIAPRRAHKGKSALRLKPSKATKGPPKGGKAPTAEEDKEEDERARPISLPAPSKRKRDEEQPTRKPSKRRGNRLNEAVDEGISMADSPDSTTGSEEIPATPNSDAAPGAGEADTSASELAHHPDPVQEDTWTCALDGCTHKVYAASTSTSQALIKEHYALHAYDDDERVKMVKQLQAPSLPVRHLMEKVRMQARVEGFPGSRVAGTRFPEPVSSRY